MPYYAFSSDSREFYKADIYRALSLPKGHALHFRYKNKYVEKCAVDSPEKLKNKQLVIVFTVSSGLVGHSSDVVNIPIRKAEIVNASYSEVTDVFHVYMKLGEFCCANVENISSEKKPMDCFFSYVEDVEPIDVSWKTRVDAVSRHRSMPETYFYIRGLYHETLLKKRALVNPVLNRLTGMSFYNLEHGENYFVSVSMANPDGVDSDIIMDYDKETVSANVVNPLVTSVQYDDIYIPISIRSLQIKNVTTILRFVPSSRGDVLGQYFTNVELRLKMGWRKPLIFSSLVLLAFWGVMIAKQASCGWWLAVSSGMIGLSSGVLFHTFNKK